MKLKSPARRLIALRVLAGCFAALLVAMIETRMVWRFSLDCRQSAARQSPGAGQFDAESYFAAH
jgi:hypothetical protein